MNRKTILAALTAAVLICAFAVPGSAAEPGPSIRLRGQGDDGAVFEVVGLDRATLAKLAEAKLKPEQWAALFAVHTQKEDGPAFLGTYQVTGKALRFRPRFPLARGVRYLAVFDPSRLPGQAGSGKKPIRAEFTLARPAAPATVVRQVYPSAGELPENLLKFYIHFSAPMSQGEVYRHIKLLNPAGKPVELPFLELEDELWDAAGRRFTLFIDPGRIKRGLQPRENLGPVLEKGKSYTLVIDQKWLDAAGNPLRATFRKTFKVLPPVDRAPGPDTWKLTPPRAGTKQPLTVRFPRPMDNALLHRVLWVADAQGKRIPGDIDVTDHETCWQFRPAVAWQPGRYALVAQTTLEDLAGNNLERPFEIDVFHPIPRRAKVKTVEVPFQVKTP